jgi:hypothetical protein
MPCRVVKVGDTVAFVCGPRQRSKPCVGCGKPHTKLCDFPLMGPKAGKTCDRPLCDRCAVSDGDIDYCPTHARILGKVSV